MNSNNTYFGNYAAQKPSTTPATVAYPYKANQMRNGTSNQTQGFENMHNDFYSGTWQPLPDFYAVNPTFGTTAVQGQYVNCNVNEYVIHPQIHGNSYHHTGNSVYQQPHGQAYQGFFPQQQQLKTSGGYQAPLPVIQTAPQSPIHQQPQQHVIQSVPHASVSAPSTSNSLTDPLFNPLLPPFANPSTLASHQPITVELCNQALWQMFNKLGNEMSVNNAGKELFPHLFYNVSGLNRGLNYKFVLWMERVDEFVYNWNSKDLKFEKTNEKDVGKPVTNQISSEIQSGGEWEDEGVEFEEVNLHNIGKPPKIENATKQGPKTLRQLGTAQKKSRKLGKPRILVSLNCKYIPVLAIFEVSNGVCIQRGEYRFEETTFMVVVDYRNTVVRDHKSALNSSVKKKTRIAAQKRLEERREQASRSDSAYSSGSDATPPPATQFFGADGSLPTTSSGY